MAETITVYGQTFSNVTGVKLTDGSSQTVRMIKPEGSISISANGTVDVAAYESAVVVVPNTYTAGDEGKVVQSGALVAQGSSSYSSNGTYDTTYLSAVTVDVQGGGGATVTPLSVSANGTYTAPSGTAYSPVTVAVEDVDPNWRQIDAFVIEETSTYSYHYLPDTDTKAYKDIFIRLTAPANKSWSDWPSVQLCRHDYAEGSFPEGYTPTAIDEFTLNTKTTAATADTYCTVLGKAIGNARITVNGFEFTTINSVTNVKINAQATSAAKPWFHIISSNNFINCISYKNLPSGTYCEVYAARPVDTVMPLS